MNLDTRKPIWRDEISEEAKSRAKFDGKQLSDRLPQHWAEAEAQVGRGWLAEPFLVMATGKPRINGKQIIANRAYRFGAQQADKLSGVAELRRSSTSAATAVCAPINLPSWDR